MASTPFIKTFWMLAKQGAQNVTTMIKIKISKIKKEKRDLLLQFFSFVLFFSIFLKKKLNLREQVSCNRELYFCQANNFSHKTYSFLLLVFTFVTWFLSTWPRVNAVVFAL